MCARRTLVEYRGGREHQVHADAMAGLLRQRPEGTHRRDAAHGGQTLKVAAAPDLTELIRGRWIPTGWAPRPGDYYVGGRALIARFPLAARQYPNFTTRLNTALVDLVVEDGRVVGAVPRQTAPPARSGPVAESCWLRVDSSRTTSCGPGSACRDHRGTRWGRGEIRAAHIWRASPRAPTPI